MALFDDIINNPMLQTGAGLFGAANPSSPSIQQAANVLAMQRKWMADQEYRKAQVKQMEEHSRLYGGQVEQQGVKNRIEMQRLEIARRALREMGIDMGDPQQMPGAQGQPQQPQMQQPMPGGPAMPAPIRTPQLPQQNPIPSSVGRHGTPTYILQNLVGIESGGNPHAIGPLLPNGERAIGLGQFVPSTIKMLKDEGYTFNPLKADESLDAMDYYLQKLYKQHGTWEGALAAYGGFKTKDPTDYIKRALKGSPENQAAQSLDLKAQAAASKRAQQLAGVVRFGMGDDMGITDAAKALAPDYELPKLLDQQERTRIQGQEAATKAAAEGRQQEKAGRERAEDVAKDWQSINLNMANLNLLTQKTMELQNSPGGKRIFGSYSYFPNWRGGEASDAQALHKSITSQMAKEALTALREASKTGGALGNVSDADIELLRTAIVSLEEAQSWKSAQNAITTVNKQMMVIRNKMIEGFERKHKSSPLGDDVTLGSRMVGVSPEGVPLYRTPDGKTFSLGE